MIATSFAVGATKFLFDIYNCTVDIDVGKGDFWLMLQILHMCGHAHMRSHMSSGMDCNQNANHDRTLSHLGLI